MITELFSDLGIIIADFASFLGDLFTNAISIFYDAEEAAMTPIGTLMLLGLGTGLLIWGFRFIRKLIRVRTK